MPNCCVENVDRMWFCSECCLLTAYGILVRSTAEAFYVNVCAVDMPCLVWISESGNPIVWYAGMAE